MTPVVVITLNNLRTNMECVDSLMEQDCAVDVWAFDNGSTDGTVQWALSRRNLSFVAANKPSVAAAWNMALRLLFSQYDAVVIVNNDTILRPDTVRHLVADGGLFVTAVGRSERSAIDLPHLAPEPANKRPHPDFSCFLIRRECWQRVGPFDEGFIGGYAEDADYHLRMHRAGIQAEALELPFYHVACGTIKSASDAERAEIIQRADANRARFKEKWGVAVGSPEYYALFGTTGPEAAGSAPSGDASR